MTVSIPVETTETWILVN